MRDRFEGYYTPLEEEFEEMWESGLFAFDANILLNLYRVKRETAEKFLDILHHMNGQIWLPHQAGLEYHRKRLDVIWEFHEDYCNLMEEVEGAFEGLRNKISSDYQRHPRIDTERVIDHLKERLESLDEYLQTQKDEATDYRECDDLRARITKMFEERIGTPYSDTRLQEIKDEGSERYEQEIPPGYKDEGDENEYGDLILWFQVIDKAKEFQGPIVIITDDLKEDWWWKHRGRTQGPRPELVDEMRQKADTKFYMYNFERFLKFGSQYRNEDVHAGAIEDAKDIAEWRGKEDTQPSSPPSKFSDFKNRIRNAVAHGIVNHSAIFQLAEQFNAVEICELCAADMINVEKLRMNLCKHYDVEFEKANEIAIAIMHSGVLCEGRKPGLCSSCSYKIE